MMLTLALMVLGLRGLLAEEALVVVGGIGTFGYTRNVDVITLTATEVIEVHSDWIPDVPQLNGGQTAQVLDNEVMVCGGAYNGRRMCSHLDIPSLTWWQTSVLTKNTNTPASAVHDGTMVIFGGWADTGTTQTVERYSKASNSWAQVAEWSMPQAQRMFCAVENGGYIYLIGGIESPRSKVYKFDPATNSYEEMADLLTGRYGHACALTTVGGEQGIMVTGGFDAMWNTLWSTEFYGIASNSWRALGNMNVARCTHGMGVLNGKPVVVGGTDIMFSSKDSIEVYNEASDSWTQATATLPQPKSMFGYAVADL